MKKSMIQMQSNDNVATALSNIEKGDEVKVYNQHQKIVCEMVALEQIIFGNKIALQDINKDKDVFKYGEKIGIAIKPIEKGRLVHVHNVKSLNLDIPDKIIKEIIQVMNIED